MSWSLNLVIKFCLVLILVTFGANAKRSGGSDKGHQNSAEDDDVPVLSVRNPVETHGLGKEDLSKEFGSEDDEPDRIPTALGQISAEMAAEELTNLHFIGCYDVWENSSYTLVDEVWDSNDLGRCASSCRRRYDMLLVKEDYLVGVRNQSCVCPYTVNFRLVRIAPEYCPIPCPDSLSKTCGGNYSISVYCVRGFSRECSAYAQVPVVNLYNLTTRPDDPPPRPLPIRGTLKGPPAVLDRWLKEEETTPMCANCSSCKGVLRPSFDYIPKNNPALCAQFCRRKITYFHDREIRFREPTEYAITGWYNSSALVSACSCLDGFTFLQEVEDSFCDTPCDNGERCGSDHNYIMVNIFSTRTGEGEGPGSDPVTNPSDPIRTTTPPDDDDDDDDDSSEEDSSEDTGKCNGKKQCQGTDPYGGTWKSCAGDIPKKKCPNGAAGRASWKCLASGEFEGLTPVYVNCKTEWIQSIQEALEGPVQNATAIGILTNVEDLCVRAEKLENKEAQYFGHEISSILGIAERVVKDVNLTGETDVMEFEKLTTKVAHIGSSILANPRTWKQLSPINSSEAATSLLWTLEESSFELTQRVEGESGPRPNYNRTFTTRKISLAAGVVGLEATGNGTLMFVDEGSWIILPPGWTSVVPAIDNAQYVGMAIVAGDSGDVNPFPNNVSGLEVDKKALNGKIMSFSLTRPSDINSTIDFTDIGAAVDIHIHHKVQAWGNGKTGKTLRRKLHFGDERKAILGTAVCVYWDTTKGIWSDNGCTLVESDGAATRCECTHLTSFAVLFSYYDYVGKSIGLEVLTVVLCSLSVICLFATIVIFTVVKTTQSSRTTITKNLAFCLLISNTLILLVVDRNYFNMTEGVCIGAGILTHYAYLCAFMWMGIEGYHLYKMMIHVFDSGSSHMTFIRILAYGFPLIIIVITGVIGALRGEPAYGGEQFCWLNGNYVLAFMVPVALVVCVNLIVLFITLRTAYHVQSSPGNSIQERKKSNRTWVRGCFSITILLGITWIIGYLEMVNNSIVSEVGAYIFTILNASQGFLIFIFHCLMNEKVRVAAERRNISYPYWFFSAANTTNTNTSAPSGSNGNSRFGKQNLKSFYSGSPTAPLGKREKKFSGGGPLEDFGNRRIQNTFSKSQDVSNLNNGAGHGGGGWPGNRHGTLSSSSSVLSSGNETNGSERDLLPSNLHLRRGSRH